MSDVVTGAGGFAGRALVRELAARGRHVVAWCRDAKHEHELRELGARDVHVFDIADEGALVRALERAAPTRVFHLAALASPRACAADPALAHAINVDVVRRLLGAVARGTRTVIVSSAAVYAPSARALDEDAPLAPRGVYGATKLAAEEHARSAAAAGADVVIARPFNHAGPGQAAEYALPSFVRRLVRFREHGGAIEVGDLSVVRDFMHVRDTVRAYAAIAERAASGAVINVCSGRATRLVELFDGLARRILSEGRAGEAQRALVVAARLLDDQSSSGTATASPSGSTLPAVSALVGAPYRLATLPFAPLFGLDELLDDLFEDAGASCAKPR
jgi:GDP-4-dehydro-6-deoxy-D-mannose reductase